MSQEAVERALGRMLTDVQFRTLVGENLESASQQAGFQLTRGELQLLSTLELPEVAELAGRLNPGLCRAGGAPGAGVFPHDGTGSHTPLTDKINH